MAFQQGLSGLKISSQALDVISNNVANASTVGFKASQAQFADVYASSLQVSGAGNVGIGSRAATIAQQFTQGNLISTNNPLDIGINGKGFFAMQQGDGSITYSRNGQFKLDKNGFITDASGRKLTGVMADSTGLIVEKPPTDQLQVSFKTGNPSATTASTLELNLDSRAKTPSGNGHGSVRGTTATTVFDYSTTSRSFNLTLDGGTYSIPITLDQNYVNITGVVNAIQAQIDAIGSPSKATVSADASNFITIQSASTGRLSDVTIAAGAGATAVFGGTGTQTQGTDLFSINGPTTYTSSTAMNIYDSLGNPHTMTYYYVKTAEPNVWDMYTSFDGASPTAPTTWDSTVDPGDAVDTTVPRGVRLTFSSAGVLVSPTAANMPNYAVNFNNGSTQLSMTVDLASITQFGSNFAVASLEQDGVAPGELAGINVAKDGIIQARYDNGQTRNIGRIALFDFKNPNGLQPLGDNQWAESAESGQPTPGKPAVGIFGQLQSSGVEESNVDLTAELVSMITQQRNYQANAQSIKTQDSILQTLVNLR